VLQYGSFAEPSIVGVAYALELLTGLLQTLALVRTSMLATAELSGKGTALDLPHISFRTLLGLEDARAVPGMTGATNSTHCMRVWR
jgi:hypothetical protein